MLSCSQNLEPEPQKLQKSSFLSVEEQAKIALTSKRIFRATDDILLAYSSQKNATLDDVISNPASFLDDVIDDLKQSEDSVEFNQAMQNQNIASLKNNIDFNNTDPTLNSFITNASPNMVATINDLSNRLTTGLINKFSNSTQDSLEIATVARFMEKIVVKYENDVASNPNLTLT
jgi:hypothetical protein